MDCLPPKVFTTALLSCPSLMLNNSISTNTQNSSLIISQSYPLLIYKLESIPLGKIISENLRISTYFVI